MHNILGNENVQSFIAYHGYWSALIVEPAESPISCTRFGSPIAPISLDHQTEFVNTPFEILVVSTLALTTWGSDKSPFANASSKPENEKNIF